MAVARERLAKHVPTATDTHATIEESLETVFVFYAVRAVFYVVRADNDAMQQ
jgi:hypothetical protein